MDDRVYKSLVKRNLQFIFLVQCRLHRKQVFAKADIFSTFLIYINYNYGNNLFTHIERTEGIECMNHLSRKKIS